MRQVQLAIPARRRGGICGPLPENEGVGLVFVERWSKVQQEGFDGSDTEEDPAVTVYIF